MSEPTAISLELNALCQELKLSGLRQHAEQLAEEATRQGRSTLDVLVELLQLEVDGRRERRAQRRLKEAHFPLIKTLEGFDFSKAPHLPEPHLRQLAHGEWIDRAESVLLVGEPGTGKTHLATALGVCAAEQGRRVRFITAARLANELTEARDHHELSRVVGRYSRVELLVLDEVGYVPLSKSDAELLFQVLGERQERRSLIMTTNLPFSEWTQVFTDARLCRAVLDRITHNAHIIETGETSIRLQQAKASRKTRS